MAGTKPDRTGIARGMNKGYQTTLRDRKPRISRSKGRISKRTAFVREIVKEVAVSLFHFFFCFWIYRGEGGLGEDIGERRERNNALSASVWTMMSWKSLLLEEADNSRDSTKKFRMRNSFVGLI